MTTKDKAVVGNRDHQGQSINNWRLQELAADPGTTYPRIYYNTVTFRVRYYDTDAAAWADMGSGGGGGAVDSVTPGHGMDNSGTSTDPILDVDETELAVPQANVTNLTTDLGAKAPLNSPAFTGTPTAATAGAGTNSTQVATTAYADAKVADAINDSVTGIAPSQNAVFDALALKAPVNSPTLTGTPAAPTASGTTNTTQIATTAMVQAALAAYIAAQDVLVFKGGIDCSANPNYPAADAGHVYKVSVAGKIGGGSGPNVEVGDVLTCTVDGSTNANHATVGTNWIISQVNIDGAVTGPASATTARIATFNGTTGKIIQDGGVTVADLATVASPTFTGDPKAPTPSAGDNDTSLATTAFVQAALNACRYSNTYGDGATEDIVVTHSLGTRDVTKVTARDLGSPYADYDIYWEATSTSTVTVFFPTGQPPALNSVRISVSII